MFDLKNKNVLLVGASSGIGLELAKQLLKEDCNLSLLARRKELIDEQLSNVKDIKRKIISIKCDVTLKEEVKIAVAEAKYLLGNIDVLIYNSGISTPQSIKNFNNLKSEEVFNVNVILDGARDLFQDADCPALDRNASRAVSNRRAR